MNLNDLVQRVKAHPQIAGSEINDLADDNFAFTVGQLAITELADLSERLSGVIDKRNYIFSDPDTTTATLDADGAVELTTLIVDNGLLLEGLRHGEIKHPSSPYPLKQISGSGEGALGSNWGGLGFLRYWLVGTKLHTLSGDNNTTPLTGDLSFATPRDQGLDTLHVHLENDLVNAIVMRLRAIPVPPPAKAVAR